MKSGTLFSLFGTTLLLTLLGCGSGGGSSSASNSATTALQAIMRVSVDSSGAQGNGNSWVSSISSDGRYVAFSSAATNLVSGDTNGATEVFRAPNQ